MPRRSRNVSRPSNIKSGTRGWGKVSEVKNDQGMLALARRTKVGERSWEIHHPKALPTKARLDKDYVSDCLCSPGSHVNHVVFMSQYWMVSGDFRQLSWTVIKHFICFWIWDMKQVLKSQPYQHTGGFWRVWVVAMQNQGNIEKNKKKIWIIYPVLLPELSTVNSLVFFSSFMPGNLWYGKYSFNLTHY